MEKSPEVKFQGLLFLWEGGFFCIAICYTDGKKFIKQILSANKESYIKGKGEVL